MTTINQLSSTDTVSAADLVPIFSSTNGDARKAAMSVLLAYISANLGSATYGFTTQYATPSSGGTVNVTSGNGSVHLIATPAGSLSSLTIVLPSVATLNDKDEFVCNSTQAVTTLIVNDNDAAALNGAPSSLTANGYFRLKYDGPTKTWYRIG